MEYDVTIGIPVYNAERYIRKSIESALAQTFKSIEFLICDDCTPDNSIRIIEEYKNNHHRGKDIRIIKQSKNMGVGNTRNKLIAEARGKYFFFLDSDDEIFQTTIELLYSKAKEVNADIVYGSYLRIEEFEDSPKTTEYCYPDKQFLDKDEFATYAYNNYNNIQATTWNFLIRTQIFHDNNIIYPDINFWEDFAMTIELPTYIERAVLLSDITYKYYCRYGSLSNFQQRSRIDKNEILKTANAIQNLKYDNERIANKSYFLKRMLKVMLTNFYVVCNVIKKERIIYPHFTKSELGKMISMPLTLNDIISFKNWNVKIFLFYLLNKLPDNIVYIIIKQIGIHRKLI